MSSFFRLHGKGHKKYKWLVASIKKNLVFLIRNISSKELHSALGKISVVNLMYNLLGLKNCFGLKI
jgi:hypothetical protein